MKDNCSVWNLNKNKNGNNNSLTVLRDVVTRDGSTVHVYHYSFNDLDCGKKTVNDFTRQKVIDSIYDIETKLTDLQKNPASYEKYNILDEIKKIGKIIYAFILSDEVATALFDEKIQGQHIIIEKTDHQIPLELAYNGKDFLCLLHSFGRAVHKSQKILPRQIDPKKLNVFILSNPTEDIPYSESEGRKISDLMGKLNEKIHGDMHTKHHTGKEVTKDLVQFDILLNSECNILHYSGHCYFDNTDTEQSGLVLHGGQTLTAVDLAPMTGNPIIFNNSCSSGLGKEKKTTYGRGSVEGLATHFVNKGAVAYIGTLWPVQDDVAMEVAILFYQNFLEKGLTLGESLRLAKKQIFEGNLDSNFSCLAYVLYGDPSFRLHQVIEEQNRIQSTLWNENAIYEIIKYRKEYSALEIDCFNDHQWIFWPQKKWESLIKDTVPSEEERKKLFCVFPEYKKYFRDLTMSGKKCFKIILNLKTIKKYFESLDANEGNEFINDNLKFLDLSNFQLLFYNGPKDEIDEYTMVSKNSDENEKISDNLCIVMKQPTTEDDKLFTYFMFDNSPEVIKRYIQRYNLDKQICLEQYKDKFSSVFPFLTEKETCSYSEEEIKKVTRHILENLLRHADD